MSQTEIGERIKIVRGEESLPAFAERFGVHKNTLIRYEKGESQPDAAFLKKICDKFNVHPTWLLTGEGPLQYMDIGGFDRASYCSDISTNIEKETEKYRKSEGLRLEKEMLNYQDFILVPRYDVNASAGPGAALYSEQIVDHLAFKRKWIKDMGLQEGSLALVTAKGDSMEPTIRDGSLLLVDMREGFPKSDGVYILRFNSDLVAKRIQILVGGDIKIKSDNPRYEEQHLTHHQAEISLKVVGKVVWGGWKM